MVVLGLLTILSGCGGTDREALSAAAEVLGRSEVRPHLADLPAECRRRSGRVVPQIGEKPRWTQKRWEYVADATDRQIANCAGFYDRQKELLQR